MAEPGTPEYEIEELARSTRLSEAEMAKVKAMLPWLFPPPPATVADLKKAGVPDPKSRIIVSPSPLPVGPNLGELEKLPDGSARFTYTGADAATRFPLNGIGAGGMFSVDPLTGLPTYTFTGSRADAARIGGSLVPNFEVPVPATNLSFVTPTGGPETALAQVLSQTRQKFLVELRENPQLLAQVHACARCETGDMVALLEAMMNYADRNHKTLQQTVFGGFYGPVNRGEMQVKLQHLSAAEWANFNAALPIVFGGSNKVGLATDQGLPNEIRGDRWVVSGENYGHFNGDPSWANRKLEEARTLAASLKAGGVSTPDTAPPTPDGGGLQKKAEAPRVTTSPSLLS